ncbi:ATP-binding protein [Terribacillus sp. 179-K 1B1 HS]|uniref:hybrid sensor histidine kinase/response regulator n=1 Tax=Terribacillus sp. 179-K 1B1 HS TaxID=3142388 RepID=UPI0039A0FD29
MKRSMKLITILAFAAALTLGRIVWYHTQTPDVQPAAVGGQLDVRQIDFSNSHSITLDEGEWKLTKKTDDPVYQPLPTYMKPEAAGTYEMNIQVDDQQSRYALSIRALYSDFTVYANDQLVYQTVDFEKGPPTPVSITDLRADQNGQINVKLRFDEFHGNERARSLINVGFGSSQQIQKETYQAGLLQFFVGAIIFIHALYAFVLYLMKPKKIGTLFFSIAAMAASLAVVTSDYNTLGYVMPLRHEWYVRIVYLSYIGLSFFFLLFVVFTFTKAAFKWPFKILYFLFISYLIYILAAPIEFVRYVIGIAISLVAAFSIIFWILFRTVYLSGERALPLFLAGAAVVSHVAWTIFVGNIPILEDTLRAAIKASFYPFDITMALVCFCSFWFLRFFQTEAENKQYIEQLEMEQKRKDQFLANTSHELRTPLHGMMNMVQSVLQQENKLKERSRYQLELIHTISRKMSYLINDLIDVTQITSNRVRLEPASISIAPILIGTVDMLRFMTDEKRVNIHLRMPDNLPSIYADEHRLTQIVTNMLHNALKFTPEGNITVDVSADESNLRVKVTDTGIGMDAKTQARIFLPYEKGENSISESEGIGLGLGISRQLAEMHGGSLTAESELGKGSVFTLSLPIGAARTDKSIVENSSFTESAASEQFHDSAVPAAVSGHRILVIDDDPVNLMILRQALETDGYHIRTAASSAEFFQQLEAGRWDLLIIDVMMPEISGFQLTKMIRSRYSLTELPVLLLTARSQPEDIHAGFQAGANEYVTKPVDMHEMKTRIRSLLELKVSIEDRLRIEAAWLQAQIHPHFLFNTLNTIAALSSIDNDRMMRLLQEFGNYLQASFNGQNLSSIIPIQREMELVHSYLYIQKERFGEKLRVNWEIDRELQFSIPPLTLQPLVENAVLHGLQPKEEGGTILIHLFKKGSNAIIHIKDDGVGIPPVKQRSLNISEGHKDSIGLINTHARLQKWNGCGLILCSEEGLGTTIQISIPLIDKNEKTSPLEMKERDAP